MEVDMGKQDGSERTTTEGDVDDSGTPFLHIDMDAFFASGKAIASSSRTHKTCPGYDACSP